MTKPQTTAMILAEIELPSNRKFGFFFTFLFAVLAVYFYVKNSWIEVYLFGALALIFLCLTVVKANLLQPLNKLWMNFGLFLGKIFSPIILGFIFFGLFMPAAFFMRLIGRDELQLKLCARGSYWKSRIEQIQPSSFKRQF